MPADVFLLRGAEGGFASWLKDNGGPHNGLLLSSANSVPGELVTLIGDIVEVGSTKGIGARPESQRSFGNAFAAVGELPYGNAFSNANRALAPRGNGRGGAGRWPRGSAEHSGRLTGAQCHRIAGLIVGNVLKLARLHQSDDIFQIQQRPG